MIKIVKMEFIKTGEFKVTFANGKDAINPALLFSAAELLNPQEIQCRVLDTYGQIYFWKHQITQDWPHFLEYKLSEP